jgi:SpoIIAA-like
MEPAADAVYFNALGVASVRWDEEGQVVLVEWEGWANSSEFSELLEAELTALREHRCSRVLADCRRQKVLNPADQDRANQVWLPRALAAGLKRFAVVIPSSVLAEVNLKDSLGKVAPKTLEVAYFATPEEAREWLGRQ